MKKLLLSALLLAPLLVLAADDGEPCPPQPAGASARNAPEDAADPGRQGAGASPPSSRGEAALPRTGQPRWHSFLPGMIR